MELAFEANMAITQLCPACIQLCLQLVQCLIVVTQIVEVMQNNGQLFRRL